MAQNWLRKCQLTVGGTTINGGGQTDLRIVFEIKQWHVQAPNMLHARVYNPSPSTAQALKAAEGSKVTFSAGYESNFGLVFSGDLKQTIVGHETAVDSYAEIFAADMDQAYNKARVTKTLQGGWTPQDKLNAAVQAMGTYGLSMGFNGIDLSQPKFPRGIPLIGMARDIIRQVVLSKQGLWSMQLGKLQITDKTMSGASTGGPIELTASTGLIGWPKQTQDGILVRSLLNPSLQPLQQIKLDPSQIIAAERDNNPFSLTGVQTNQQLTNQVLGSGTYAIFHMDRFGDTRGPDWYDESMCVGAGGSVPDAQKDLGYYVPFS